MLQERRGSRPGTPSNNRTPSTRTRPFGVRQFHLSKIDDKPLYLCAFIKPDRYFQEYIRIVLQIDYTINIHCIEHITVKPFSFEMVSIAFFLCLNLVKLGGFFFLSVKSRLGDYFKSKLPHLRENRSHSCHLPYTAKYYRR